MKESVDRKLSGCLRAVAAAMVAGVGAAAPLAHGWPAEKPIVLQPAALPELARQAGQAMLLHDSDDGRTLLYVEQGEGARLAIFDVTNPARIRGVGVVQLDAPGPFDFVSASGDRAEVVRFREGRGDALLDLNQADAPALRSTRRLSLQGGTTPQIWDDIDSGGQIDRHAPLAQDDPPVGSEVLQEFNDVVDLKHIQEWVTKRDTNTTFLLTESGLYVIRRPSAERANERREDERRLMYSGG